MNGFGASAYRKVGIESQVLAADPHKLVLILFDGALNAIDLGRAHIAAGNLAGKTRAISKAIEIVDEGLRVSVDRKAGGELGDRLVQLYNFTTMRLLQANLRNDVAALDEARRILAGLREAWARIAPSPTAARPRESAALYAN